jgi:phosphoribosyl-ATP pyrophosphohydrolase/phosphoribosyl-AMP cyclohydrolase
VKLPLQKIDWQKSAGLVAAIVQDAMTDRVLMLGYMNQEALNQTLETGLVTFYSRSKKRLWTKGETSGNSLTLRSIQVDCDGDALLVKAVPAGVTCHTGRASCFDDAVATRGLGFLGQLESIIEDRLTKQPVDSYTVKLAQQGLSRIAQKVGEEGVEVALAALQEDPDKVIGEVSDLLFHVLVLLRFKDIELAAVVGELRARHTK